MDRTRELPVAGEVSPAPEEPASPVVRRRSRRRVPPAVLRLALVVVVLLALFPAEWERLLGFSTGPASTPSPRAGSTGLTATAPGAAAAPSGSPTGAAPSPRQSMSLAPAATVVTSKLTWAPPRLSHPTTVTVNASQRYLKLDPQRDYRVVLPSKAEDLGGGVRISGGHNVVIIGGVIWIPPASEVPQAFDRRGLYLQGQTGTVHVEGVHLMGDLSDGIDLEEKDGAVVQLENIIVDMVHGSHSTNHADVLQTWAGPRKLRIDGLRGTSDYQGFFLLPNQYWSNGPQPESFVFRRTVVTMVPGSAYALWLPEAHPPWLDWSGFTVRLAGRSNDGKLSWPDSELGLRVIGPSQQVSVPEGTVGGGYKSPGYLGAPGQ